MKRKTILLVAGVLIGVIAWAAYTRYGNDTDGGPRLTADERRIQREIDKANRCETADDCAQAGSGICPFGCYIHVNKDEVERIQSMLVEYQKSDRPDTCMYMCIEYPGVDCVKGKCELRQP